MPGLDHSRRYYTAVSGSLKRQRIDRAARILPQRHSDLFFILEHHITLTRAQLASRLVEVRSPCLGRELIDAPLHGLA
jgi:hypothetical protein